MSPLKTLIQETLELLRDVRVKTMELEQMASRYARAGSPRQDV